MVDAPQDLRHRDLHLTAAEKDQITAAMADGREADAVAKHGAPMVGSLMLKALRGETIRMAEHVFPAVEEVLCRRLDSEDHVEAERLRTGLRVLIRDWIEVWEEARDFDARDAYAALGDLLGPDYNTARTWRPQECGHAWLDRPESDTRECTICGVEA